MDKSNYFNTLPREIQERYLEKLNLTNSVDPYLLKFGQCSTSVRDFPKISFFDIINYLVFKKSAFTEHEFRAYKSMDAYNFFVCKWVRKLAVKPISNSNRILVISQVMHSQRLNLPALNVWIVSQQNGEILTAHCDCVAGLAEACSHVGATLFAAEDAVRSYNIHSVTETKAYWMPPSEALGAPAKVSEVDYLLRDSLNHLENVDVVQDDTESDSELCATSEDYKSLQMFDKLFDLRRKSAVLHMFKPYANKLQEEAMSKKASLRGVLDNIYNKENCKLLLDDLIHLGKTIDCSVDVNEVEKKTRKQSNSKSWFLYRAGRITASNFKSVCHTKIEKPSISVLQRICYPNKNKFKSVYTDYGCKHEKKALDDFVSNYLKSNHSNLKAWKVGLFIDVNNPFFGASPDLMVSCNCCGKGCVEIKCPYCVKDTTIEEITNFKQSFLKPSDKEPKTNHLLYLDNKHAYYYQVQMQMAVTNTKYCYFVAWTKANMFFEKIEFNIKFWNEKKEKGILFHERVVMPELLAKYFTNKKDTVQTQPSVDLTAIQSSSKAVVDVETAMLNEETLWCTCKMPESGRKMVMCSNNFCKTKRFHLSCVKLKSVPKGSWYCKQCGAVNFNKKN